MATPAPYPSADPASAGARLTTALQDLEGDRLLGIIGALTMLISTALSWYSREVTVSVNGVVDNFTTDFTLWHVRGLAAWLLLAGALVGMASLALTTAEERRGGLVAAVIGFGAMVYGLVAIFTPPSLGSGAIIGGTASAALGTAVDVGPFVAGLGGFLLLLGGLVTSSDAGVATAARRDQGSVR